MKSASRPITRFAIITAVALVTLWCATVNLDAAASNSIARTWNERALAAIRQDTPHPPAQARNLFGFSIAMYDAWAAYDTNAVGYIYRGKHTAGDVAAARREAISYAVFRLMRERHFYSRTASNTLVLDTNLITSLGYDPSNTNRDTATPAGVGNSVFDAVSLWFSDDGSRQTNGTPYNPALPATLPIAYPDYPIGNPLRYAFINPALATDRAGIDDGFGNTVVDINRWQRLNVVNAVDQNGFPTSPQQPYLGAQWLGVRPFSLRRALTNTPWIDPGPPPFFGGPRHAEFVTNIVEVIRRSSQLTPNDGVTLDISPASQGNNSLGANDGSGRPFNPITSLPYAPNIALRGDFARALTEFWADGPTSETPPGHWNVIANDVADHPLFVKKIGGIGPAVNDLEWDVKMYFTVNAAAHDAACAAWGAKRYYDGYRPLSAVRYLGMLGQSSEPASPSYNANGLPLITNLIELVTASSVSSGRHAGLTPNKIAVLCWPGETPQRVTNNGVRWLHVDTWTTYQRSNFVTPAFPGYISGHSTFSRSIAQALTSLTGTEYFPGGMGSYTITSLLNEQGPSAPVTLQWATYYDAADQIGISRIWGGIHPPADDYAGRQVGAHCGSNVWNLARRYWDGSVTNTPVTIARLSPTQYEVRYESLRGLYYDFRSSVEAGQTFTNDPPGTSLPFEALSVRRTNNYGGPVKFHRAVGRLVP